MLIDWFYPKPIKLIIFTFQNKILCLHLQVSLMQYTENSVKQLMISHKNCDKQKLSINKIKTLEIAGVT